MPQVESIPGAWRLGHGLVIGAILIVAVAAGWWTRPPELGVGGDETTYVILSRSLEQGRYHDEYLEGSPPHAKYPPGMPAWIGLIRQVAGPDLDALRAANLLLLALTALIMGDALRRLSGPWTGIGGVAMTAMSPGLLEFSGLALPEVPFTFLVSASLWLTLRTGPDDRGGQIAAALGTALLSFLLRSAGITAVAGVIAWLLVRRRWRAGLVSLLVSGIVIGGWFAYAAHAASGSDPVSSYARNLSKVASTGPGGVPGLVLQVTDNARRYLLALPASLGVPTLPGTPIDNLIWLAVLSVFGVVGMVAMLRRWPAAGVHLLLSVALLLAWPWPIARLLIPLLPLTGAVLLLGSFILAGKVGRKAETMVPAVLGLLLATAGGLGYLAQDTNHQCDRRNPYDDPGCFSPGNRDMVRAARMIRNSAPPGTVIATGRPAAVFYFSGHLTRSLLTLRRLPGDSARPEPVQTGVWILLSDLNAPDARRLLERGCDRLEVRARLPRVLLMAPRVTPGPGRDACTALRQLVPETTG